MVIKSKQKYRRPLSPPRGKVRQVEKKMYYRFDDKNRPKLCSTKPEILQYCTRNTPVIKPKLLEYCTRITRVLHPKYSSTAPELLEYP